MEVVNISNRERTRLDLSKQALTKLRSAEYLYNSLSAGSKHLLRKKTRDLTYTRGFDPVFDKPCVEVVRAFARKDVDIESEIRYLNELKDVNDVPFSRSYWCYKDSSAAWNRFAEPDHSSFRWNRNYQQALEVTKCYISRWKLKPLEYMSDDDIYSALPKVNTHAGWTYILSGFKTKGENMENVYQRYSDLEREAKVTGTFGRPILPGTRTQASGEYDEWGNRTYSCKHKGRIVSMVDMLQIVGELKYAKPSQRLLSHVGWYAGGSTPTEQSIRISTMRARYPYFTSLDYSAYDQSISSWLIEDAFAILKSCFVSVDEKLFEAIVHDFIHKDFVLDEGVLHSDKGVPSGSMFTQIIDSVVNMIVINTYFISIGVDSFDMYIMGDDNLIFHSKPVDIEHLTSYLAHNFGLVVNADKSSQGRSFYDDPEFLSRFWTNHGQWREPVQLLSRLAFPERFRSYRGDVKPQHVIYAFILEYGLGMQKLIDVNSFLLKYKIDKEFVLKHVDSRYLPGSLAYIREYAS